MAWITRNSTRCVVSFAIMLSLTGCDRPPKPEADKSAPATPATQPLHQPAVSAQAPAVDVPPEVVAEWRSYRILGARYGAEILRFFSDYSCAIEVVATAAAYPCEWSRGSGDWLEVSFPPSTQRLKAHLLESRLSSAPGESATAAYLAVDVSDSEQQHFVRSDTKDDSVVRALVDAERAIADGDAATARSSLNAAVSAGDLYARIRLTAMLLSATDDNAADPATKLIALNATNRRTSWQAALAAALSASGHVPDTSLVLGLSTNSLTDTETTEPTEPEEIAEAVETQSPPSPVPSEATQGIDGDARLLHRQPNVPDPIGQEATKEAQPLTKDESIAHTQTRVPLESPAVETAPQRADWIIQVASIRATGLAERLRDELRDAGHDAYIERASVNGKTYHRVRVKAPGNRAEVDRLATQLEDRTGNKPLIQRNRSN